MMLVFLLPTTPVMAQDPHDSRELAESHYQLAVRLFGEGRYREALDEFDAAIALYSDPIFHCNRGIVLLQLAEIEGSLRSLLECEASFEGEESEKAQINAQALGIQTFLTHIRPAAISTASSLSQADAPMIVEIPAESGWKLRHTGILLVSSAAALSVAALVLDLQSAELKQQFIEESRGEPGTSRQRYEELRSSLERRQYLFVGLSGAAVLSAGIGLSMIFVDYRRGTAVGALDVSVSSEHVYLYYQLRF